MNKLHEIDTNVCGCGKPLRYSHMLPDGTERMSCNKYIICPTYDELLAQRDQFRRKMLQYEATLKQIVNVNAMDYEYRAWAKNILNENNS